MLINNLNLCIVFFLYTGKLEDARKVLQDAVATLERSLTGKQEFCQVHTVYTIINTKQS